MMQIAVLNSAGLTSIDTDDRRDSWHTRNRAGSAERAELGGNLRHRDVVELSGPLSTPHRFGNGTSPASAPPSAFNSGVGQQPGRSAGRKLAYRGVSLPVAAAKGDLPVVAMLVAEGMEGGLNVMAADKDGNTLLHFAALSDNPEVAVFVLSKCPRPPGSYNLSARAHVLEARNDAGETPLLRAMVSGHVPVVAALLDAGADWAAADNAGNTALHNAARHGSLWAMLYLLARVGEQGGGRDAVRGLLHARDKDGHTALEWACFAGRLDVVRCLLRKGLDPSQADAGGKTCLHWACSQGRADVMRYLLHLGLSLHAEDADGKTARAYAEAHSHDPAVRAALRTRPARPNRTANSPANSRKVSLGAQAVLSSPGEAHRTIVATPAEAADVQLAVGDVEGGGGNVGNGPAVDFGDSLPPPNLEAAEEACFPRRLNRTRYWVVVSHAALMCGVWAVSMAIPWWAWCLLAGGCAFLYHRLCLWAEGLQAGRKGGLSPRPSVLESWCTGPERWLAVWLGCVGSFVVWFAVLGARLAERDSGEGSSRGGAGRSIAGVAEWAWLEVALVTAAVAAWAWLATGGSDPGVVRAGPADLVFLEEEVLGGAKPPDTRKVCGTCLVRKPLRSKHCPQCGFCVARMDHHCLWLNNCVGVRNHRCFLMFVVLHFLAMVLFLALALYVFILEIPRGGVCRALGLLLDRGYFPLVLLSLVALLAACMLGAIVGEQLRNCAVNMTTNERINRRRYPWLNTPDGRPFNYYDRGCVANVWEFLGAPPWCPPRGRPPDYYTAYVLPERGPQLGARSQSPEDMARTAGEVESTHAAHAAVGRSRGRATSRCCRTAQPGPAT